MFLLRRMFNPTLRCVNLHCRAPNVATPLATPNCCIIETPLFAATLYYLFAVLQATVQATSCLLLLLLVVVQRMSVRRNSTLIS